VGEHQLLFMASLRGKAPKSDTKPLLDGFIRQRVAAVSAGYTCH